MRYLRSMAVFWGVLFIFGQGLRAAELTGAFEVGSNNKPTSNTFREGTENPQEKLGEITGTIKAIERVSGKISVLDAKGTAVEFAIESNTPVEDKHLQIGLDELRVGDRVIVRYNVEPRQVNSIEKI